MTAQPLRISVILFFSMVGAFSVQMASGSHQNEGLTIIDPRVEYQVNPLGIDSTEPRLSWIIQSERRAVHQTGYQIQVAVSERALRQEDILWDSGSVSSSSTIQNSYEGPELESGERYYWRVRVWDNYGRESAWSKISWWEMGLLENEEWQAGWIEADIEEDTATSPPAQMLRNEFELDGQVQSARVYVTSQGVYEMELNGERVGDQVLSPGWTSYSTRLQYQTYDVTEQLQKGANAVGVYLGDGWYRGYMGFSDQRNFYGTGLALLLQLEVVYEDGRREVIGSNDEWTSEIGPILKSDIYNGEHYDARLERDGWSLPGYDDSQWYGVNEVDLGMDKLIAQVAPPVRKIQELEPKEIVETPDGDIVVDMGQNFIGWIRLKVDGGEEGTEIILKHAEVLDRDGNFYTDNLRAAEQENRYILKGDGVEVWEPRFTFQGFQYVAVEGFPGELTPDNITGVVLHSDIEPAGHFESSNPKVNQLQHNIIWGQKGNFLDIPTDCPQRDERLGWTGDIQVFAETANLNMNTAGFLTKWLGDLEADQLENGSVPHVIPDVLPEGWDGAAGWADAAVIVPWSLYQAFGDIRILDKQYESMKGWVEYMRERAASTDETHLWNGDFTFGDWLSYNTERPDYPGAYTDTDLISTAFYAHSTNLLSKAANVLGRTADREQYSALFGEISEAFRDEYLTPNGRLMSNTQTAYLLALRFDLLPEDIRAVSARHLAENIEHHGHLTTGFLGTPHLNHVLVEYGYSYLAYQLLLRTDYPSWLYPVTMGATTIWERWDGIRPDGTFQTEGMNSFNHYAYGAIGEWLYKELAGINYVDPGYKSIRIAPLLGGDFSHARALIDSPYGRIESSWELNRNGFTMEVEIPVNTSASVLLPFADVQRVTIDGEALSTAADIYAFEQQGSDVLVELESGRYAFSYSSDELNDIVERIDYSNEENLNIESKLGELIAHSEARTILNRHVPSLMESTWLSQVMGFSLEYAMDSLPDEYEISDEELEAVISELEQLNE